MNKNILQGIFFGVYSAVITDIGLIFGIYKGSHSKKSILAGLATVSLCDTLADAYSLYISIKSENKDSSKNASVAGISAALCKFSITIIFIMLFFIFDIDNAIYFSVVYGSILIVVSSTYLSYIRKENYTNTIKYFAFYVIICILSYYIGFLVKMYIN